MAQVVGRSPLQQLLFLEIELLLVAGTPSNNIFWLDISVSIRTCSHAVRCHAVRYRGASVTKECRLNPPILHCKETEPKTTYGAKLDWGGPWGRGAGMGVTMGW